ADSTLSSAHRRIVGGMAYGSWPCGTSTFSAWSMTEVRRGWDRDPEDVDRRHGRSVSDIGPGVRGQSEHARDRGRRPGPGRTADADRGPGRQAGPQGESRARRRTGRRDRRRPERGRMAPMSDGDPRETRDRADDDPR